MFVASRRQSMTAGADSETHKELLSDGLKLSRLSKKHEPALDVEKSGLEQFIGTLKQGLFGVLFVMAKDASSHHAWHFVLIFFHFLQLMSFPLSASEHLPWHDDSLLSWLCKFLSSLSLTKRILYDPTLNSVACFGGLVWICGLLACAIWVGRAFIRENFVVLWPIKVLRTIATLSTTMMFIPLVASAMQVYVCNGTWGATGLQCFTGAHMLFTFVTSIVLAIFIPFAIIVGACFFDRNPHSHNFLSMPHSRVETAMLVMKAILTFVFTLEDSFGGKVMVFVVIATAIAHMYVYLYYLPFYKPAANQLHCVFAAVYAWGAVCLTVAEFRPHATDNLEGYMFLLSLPVVTYAGYAVAKSRWQTFGADSLLASVFMVEIKARYLLSEIGQENHDHTHDYQYNTASRHNHATQHDVTTENDSEKQLLIFQEVDALYSRALDFFGDSAFLHVFIAQYLHEYRANRHLELMHIAAAESKDPAIDTTFLLYQRRQQIRQEDSSSGSGSMSLMARIKFEQSKAESEENGIKARALQTEFWKELASPQPSLSRLDDLGREYDEASRTAENAYKMMLQLNPQAVSIMRKYAQFLIEVSNNSTKARKLLTDADALEESMENSMSLNTDAAVILMSKGSALDASREDLGVITVGSDDKLGIIQSLNPVAIKQFGFSRREVLGKGLETIFPVPIARQYQNYLSRYLSSGNEGVMTSSRILFGNHKTGYIFPIVLSVKPLEESFAFMVQKMPSTDQFFLLSSRTYTVLGGTQESLAMLGAEPEQLEMEDHAVTKHVSEQELEKLLAEADEVAESTANDSTANPSIMPRKLVEFRNASKDFLQSMAQGSGAFEFSAKKSSATMGSHAKSGLSIWIRLQTTALKLPNENGDSDSDESSGGKRDETYSGDSSGDESVAEADESADHLLAVRPPKRKGNRLVVMSWSMLKEGDRDRRDVLKRKSSSAPSAGMSRKSSMDRSWAKMAAAHVFSGKKSEHVQLEKFKPSSMKRFSDVAQLATAQLAPGNMRRESTVKFMIDDEPPPEDALLLKPVTKPVPKRVSVGFAEVLEPGLSDSQSVSGEDENAESSLPFLGDGHKRSSKVHPMDDTGSYTGEPSARDSFSLGDSDRDRDGAKSALEMGDKLEEKSLSFLRRALFYASLVAVAVASGAWYGSDALGAQEIHESKMVHSEGQRLTAVKQCVNEIQFWRIQSLAGASADRLESTSRSLQTALSDLVHYQNELSITYPPQTSAHIDLFTKTQFDVTRLEDGVRVATTDTLSNMLAEFISSVHILVQNNAPPIDLNEPVTYYVENNVGTVYKGLNESLYLRYMSHLTVTDAYEQRFHILALCTLLVVVAEILLVILPIAVKIGGEKHQMFDLFLKVPLLVISRLASRCQQIYEARRNQRMHDTNNEEEMDDTANHDDFLDTFDVDWSDVDFSKESGRNLSRDLKWPLVLVGKLSWSLLFAMACFAAFYFLAERDHTDTRTQEEGIYLASLRYGLVTSVFHQAQLALVSTTQADFEDNYHSTLDFTTDMLAAERKLYVGNRVTGMYGILETSREEQDLMMADGCRAYTDEKHDECQRYFHGIFKHGLHGVLLNWRHKVIAYLVKTRDRLSITSIPDRFSTDAWKEIEETAKYMMGGLHAAVGYREADTVARARQSSLVTNVVMSLYVILMIACNIVVYRPIIRQLNLAMKRNRGMLLLFPEEVVHSVPAIANLMKEYSKSSIQG